jgi:hypothetical protein
MAAIMAGLRGAHDLDKPGHCVAILDFPYPIGGKVGNYPVEKAEL